MAGPATGKFPLRHPAENPTFILMVILNFASYPDTIAVPFPAAGTWTEKLDEDIRAWTISVATAGEVQRITVPSNYGCIFML